MRERAFPEKEPLIDHITETVVHLQEAVMVRYKALCEPDWASRCVGSIAATAAAASMATRPGFESAAALRLSAAMHITCPGFHPLQLVYLALEYLCVLDLGHVKLKSGQMALSFIDLLLKTAHRPMPSPLAGQEAATQQAFAERCVEYIWSGLGKQLQRAAGVAEAELEGDGSQPAAAVTGSSSSSSSSREEDAKFKREGVEAELPADAVARMRMLWQAYSPCLFGSILLYKYEWLPG
jgi:hypothetical protein